MRDLRPLLETEYRLNARAILATFPYMWAHVEDHLGNLEADRLGVATIDAYKLKRLAEGAARGSINNELALLRKSLNLALERELISRVPKIRKLFTDNTRLNFVRPDEFRRIHATLEVLDPAAADLVKALYALGWRRGELSNLVWSEVELCREHAVLRLPASRHKNRRAKIVRIGESLASLFRRRWELRQGDYVFHREGKPLRSFRAAWRRAVQAIGRPELLVHDLRRSFARNGVLAGVPPRVLMEIAGWRTMSTFLKYAVLAEEEIGSALKRLSRWQERAEKQGGN